MTALSKLLTFAEVADLLGEKGSNRVRRVRERLMSHAAADEIIVRLGNRNPTHRSDGKAGAYGSRYLVSLSALRTHMPQVRDAANDIVPIVRAEVTSALRELDEQVTELRSDFDALGTEVGKRVRLLSEQVTHLTGVVMGGRR